MSISHGPSNRLPDSNPNSGSDVVRVPPDRLEEAISCLLAINGVTDQPRVRRFLDYAQANNIDLKHLWATPDTSGHYTSSILAVPSPGRTAMFFASHPADSSQIAVIAAMIDHAALSLNTQQETPQIHLAQALLDPSETLLHSAFTQGGFSELATLSYMERPIGKPASFPKLTWPDDITIEPFTEALEHEVIAVLEASYEDTLDCPALRGLRDTRDIYNGHRATGQFDSKLWTILRTHGQPAGVILINIAPASSGAELVYLGLAPDVRHRGLGRRLLIHGLTLAAERSLRTISLAVDERNEPAIALYRNQKFRRVLRRVAMIRTLRS
jgi:ribosomal protein S18 acetylase RimI-like enzyme